LVLPGTNVTLAVAASGTVPFRYQWRLEGIDIPNATNAIYSFTNVSLTNGHGNFSVVAANDFGTAISTNALIFVRIAPGIVTPPVAQTVLQGHDATFTCVATGAPPIFYRWLRGGVPLFTNTTGIGVFTNVQSSLTNRIRCDVRNAAGNIASSSVSLIMIPDFDADGIADSWEAQFGLNTNSAVDGLLDLDGDRMSNRDEYRAGTNPADPLSVLELMILRGNGVTLRFEAQPNVAYVVQSRTNMRAAAWQTLSNLPATDSTQTREVVESSDATDERFYRVLTFPTP
jgi:hypothetical protein